jgi:hypothetical protein
MAQVDDALSRGWITKMKMPVELIILVLAEPQISSVDLFTLTGDVV